jgi:hypothetical protein
MEQTVQLDKYLPATIREQIEQRYYAQINRKSRLDEVAHDEEFLTLLEEHVVLFGDHGVVHVRDVAHQIVRVIEIINGVLVPQRTPYRLAFMQGYGVMLAYLHDIGMVDFSGFGRAMHPDFALQAVFQPEFDAIVATIWEENCGNLAWRLLNLARRDVLPQEPLVTLRELLAMSIGHSKSNVPVEVLNDPAKLRTVLLDSAATDLRLTYARRRVDKARRKVEQAGQDQAARTQASQALQAAEIELDQTRMLVNGVDLRQTLLGRFYTDFECDAFAWLCSPHSEVQELVSDVVDTLRALRCADALRQRGTVMNTSGGYQIFLNQQTGNAIYALKKGDDDMLLLLEIDRPIGTGEANLASSELTADGDLRVSFHRGAFGSPAAQRFAVHSAAFIVNDMQGDVIGSFYGAPQAHGQKAAEEMRILLEGVDDDPEFANLVAAELARVNPQLRGRVKPVPSLQHMSDLERNRYLNAADLTWDLSARRQILERVAASGHKIGDMDPDQAFAGVREIEIRAGDVLIEAGSPPGFVYIAQSDGLAGVPLGGYRPFPVYPWTPLGSTGVIRGAPRNAAISAQKPLRLLMIPKEVYLKHWHFTYNKEEFRRKVRDIYG